LQLDPPADLQLLLVAGVGSGQHTDPALNMVGVLVEGNPVAAQPETLAVVADGAG
jgi:hypothetical protein